MKSHNFFRIFVFTLLTQFAVLTFADGPKGEINDFKKYPSCDKENKGLIFDKNHPYKNCFLTLELANVVVYRINLDKFPLDGFAEIIFHEGVRYLGPIKAGLPYGKGKVFFPADSSISSYSGEFSNAISKVFSSNDEWNPAYDASFPGILDYFSSQESNGKNYIYSPYLRSFSLALINGTGEFTYKNGTKVSGFFVNGIKQEASTAQQNLIDNNTATTNPPVVSDNRRRFALVIGNANYNTLPKLQNTINDARVMTQSLRAAGFNVSTYENLDLVGMQNAIRVFGEQLGKNDVGLVFYAGHGVQVKGKNYIVPVKENIKKSFEVPANSVDVDLLLATLENVKNDLNIVVLDACRSPFPGESRGASRGLATLDAARGTFIAFSTAPGKEALDGSESNSPYTKHLARLLMKKGLPIEQVFKEVRKAVVTETNGEQTPWENSSVMGDFYFSK